VPVVSGWYPDPMGRFEYRYHNGQAWTADVASGGRRYVDPLDGPPAARSFDPPGAPTGPGVRKVGNGIALAGMVCGIVGLVISWVPLLGLLGIVAAIVGLCLSISGLRRSRETGERRAFAITGIVTSAAGIALGVVGIVLTVVVFQAVQRFDDPGPNDARLTSCAVDGGFLVASGTIENTSSRDQDYTVLVRLAPGERRHVAVDDVAPGATADFSARSDLATFDESDTGGCELIRVYGPIPFGLDPEIFD
jgi:hypothetical protein